MIKESCRRLRISCSSYKGKPLKLFFSVCAEINMKKGNSSFLSKILKYSFINAKHVSRPFIYLERECFASLIFCHVEPTGLAFSKASAITFSLTLSEQENRADARRKMPSFCIN